MKIFLSWSGEHSRYVASILYNYFPCILQQLNVFMSEHDIESGEKWISRLTKELETTNYGILLLSQSNLTSPWLLFEAGALTKHTDSNACGLLLNELKTTDVTGPLSQFQNRRFIKNDVKSLVVDINAKTNKPLKEKQLDLLFDKFWPDMEREYSKLSREEGNRDVPSSQTRDERELLEEIIVRIRNLERNRPHIVGQLDSGNILDLPVTFDNLAAYTKWKFPEKSISAHWQERLFSDLNISKYQKLRDIDDAVNRAKKAVEAYAEEAPDLFNYGTDYITKSLGFVDKEFRGTHIKYSRTLRAFKDYGNLVK